MCKVMGIVNVTPDSFSDGGKFNTPEEAIRRAKNLIEEGAAIIDIGGESTRPGATPISWEEEWARIEPVLKGLATPAFQPFNSSNFQLSVDTYHPETAERAVAAGATIVNCVYPEPVLDMLQICSKSGAELVIPAKSLGSVPKSLGSVPIYLDPMIIGASRKRIVKRLTGEKVPGKDLAGNLTIALWAAMNGASVVRVHDVRETVQAIKVLSALKGEALPE